ncbi:PEPxxWA-CTERM sorting domain-containing protein [Sphingomonas glaciei]|uniref:PEPxxWA-CTERM sorting domain-containing protein n=1 Tax=Sphingomonas glaciei TaxID=2938948 RepID=A0ABY5MTK3_9SPHN|nr:PEPxxWA-CTERM sorting domain-containing protein [Sphingomonas glaciei]UUR07824.1 PEPxxWA-CTERM sorting domain-containing protein [Sphingomonas glaciei]
MRNWLLTAAVCLLGMASPASAALTQLTISGTATGTQTIIKCPPGAPTSCFTSYPSGNLTQSYAANFSQTILPIDLKEGDNSFTYGSVGTIGYYSGIINFSGGVLTGRNLFYSYEDPGVRTITLNSSYINASARSFSVAAVTAVPEPGTWALMLVGFLAVGSALRRKPRRTLLPA